MGVDLYGFVEGFDEVKGVWKNISPLTDLSQVDYDGYGYPKEAEYLFGKPLPEMLEVVRDEATKLTKDIFFYLSNSISLYVVELKALKEYDKHLKMVCSQNESLTTMIAQIEKLGAGYSKIRFVYDFL